MNAVIPAGGVIDAAYEEEIGTPYRALAPLGPDGIPVMQRVVDALRGSCVIDRIVAVAAQPVADQVQGVDHWLPAAASGPENILRGLGAVPTDAKAIVCTSDLPLITADAVRDFLAQCRADADISIGLVHADAYHKAFPSAPHNEFVTLGDAGPVTMSGLFCLYPSVLARNQDLLDRFFAARKSQLKMAMLLGPQLLGQFAVRRLTLAALRTRAERLLNARVDVILDVPALLAFDMDRKDDYTYANYRLSPPTTPSAGRDN